MFQASAVREQYANSTKITFFYQQNKGFLCLSAVMMLLIVVIVVLIRLFTSPTGIIIIPRLLAVAFYVVDITLDDVECPQTPFPVLHPLAPEPEPLFLSLVFTNVI